MLPALEGSEGGPCKIDIEYEWTPSRCSQWEALGHGTQNCPLRKKSATKPVPLMHIYVQKQAQKIGDPQPSKQIVSMSPAYKGSNSPPKHAVVEGKGKEIVVYNKFDALQNMIEEESEGDILDEGPKQSSPKLVLG